MTTIKLPAVLELTEASKLTEELLKFRGSEIDIDASDVTYIGAQCAQVLLSAKMTWSADCLKLVVLNPSTVFTNSLELIGISPHELTMYKKGIQQEKFDE